MYLNLWLGVLLSGIHGLCFCQVSGVVAAEYELEYLLLEGHCFDLSTGQPPRGLQFTLGMSQDPLMQDTIVMANLVSSLTGP